MTDNRKGFPMPELTPYPLLPGWFVMTLGRIFNQLNARPDHASSVLLPLEAF